MTGPGKLKGSKAAKPAAAPPWRPSPQLERTGRALAASKGIRIPPGPLQSPIDRVIAAARPSPQLQRTASAAAARAGIRMPHEYGGPSRQPGARLANLPRGRGAAATLGPGSATARPSPVRDPVGPPRGRGAAATLYGYRPSPPRRGR